jgi:ComF family protein
MGQLNRIRSSAARLLRRAAQTGAELVYPPRCAFCREEILGPADGILLCSPCRKSLTASAHAACPRCALSIEAQAAIAASTCPRCREADWKFGAAVRLGRYRDELREAILRMKRPNGEPLAAAIGKLLSESRCNELVSWRAEVVLPIPMHWRRRLSRGANSPDLLAAAIAKRLAIPVASALARRRTHPQNELPPEDRAENIRGAFRIKPSWNLSGARVLLVDDVMTTGATANEAAGVVRRGGAGDVAIAVVARAEARDFS